MSGERLWVSFWKAFGDPGVTVSGFFRVQEGGWNFAGHLGDQTWMTGSALRRGTFWLNTIVSKGGRVWEEGGGGDFCAIAMGYNRVCFFPCCFFFPEMFLKHDASHTFRAFEGPDRVLQKPF